HTLQGFLVTPTPAVNHQPHLVVITRENVPDVTLKLVKSRQIRLGNQQDHSPTQYRLPLRRIEGAEVDDYEIVVALRDRDDASQSRHVGMLPIVRGKRSCQYVQSALMVRQKSYEEVNVQAVGVFHGIANRKARLQVEQKAIVSQRTGKIEKNDLLFSSLLHLDGEVHRHRACAYSALRTHHHDQLPRVLRLFPRSPLRIQTDERFPESR